MFQHAVLASVTDIRIDAPWCTSIAAPVCATPLGETVVACMSHCVSAHSDAGPNAAPVTQPKSASTSASIAAGASGCTAVHAGAIVTTKSGVPSPSMSTAAGVVEASAGFAANALDASASPS